MSYIVQFLYLNVSCLLLSGALMMLFGHRQKQNHWLFASCCAALLPYALAVILRVQFALPVPDEIIIGCTLFGVVTIALFDNWNTVGQLTFSYSAQTMAGFILYSLWVTFVSGLGILSLIFSLFLIVLITFSLTLMLVQTFELIDVICRLRWKRVYQPEISVDYFPKVSLHVPAYNEPVDMLIETLNALADLDYPNYEVLVIDNNTTDPALWRPVEAHCEKLGFTFFHLENWPGYKSGALNYANKHVAEDTEIIGIIDSDYIVEPNYLKELVGFFKSDKVAFIQTPQDYREFDRNDKYALACYHAYQYFFKLSMATRNERNGIIFAGTMGLIRRKVLEEVGGWDEWCITEDAEVSVKILDKGYDSIFIDKTYGRGLMPLNFEGLKKQRFRWAFGGMQVLRLHWRKLLPFSVAKPNPESTEAQTQQEGKLFPGGDVHKLTLAQKFDYWSGGLQWLNDPMAFIFTMILLTGALTYVLFNTIYLESMVGATLYVPFVFILFGIVKSLWALRIRLNCSLWEAYRAFMVLLSLTWVVTLACFLGLVKEEGVFLRTPKQADSGSMGSYRIVTKEIALSLICLMGIAVTLGFGGVNVITLLLAGLLLWQSYIYGASLIVNRWSNLSLQFAHMPYQKHTSKSKGNRVRAMVSDMRAAIAVISGLFVMVFFYYYSIQHAPNREIAFRANPLNTPLITDNLIDTSAEAFVKALILLEEDAAISGNVDKALALWHSDGEIRDARQTMHTGSDDVVWRGIERIRERYVDEFKQRKYYSLKHENISILVEGDRATVVNDLSAEFSDRGQRKQVFLANGDKWELRKIDNKWKIVRLTLNRISN